MNYKLWTKNYGFTLVELIVVITIIAILGTVGFISYSNYLITARDSNRVSQSVRIADALQTYTTQNSLPLPENSITITDGWTVLSYQGDLWEGVLQTIDYSTTARDPRDNTPFVYVVDAARQNFQITSYMENPLSHNIWTSSQVYAGLANRFPVAYGIGLWALLEENTLIPIHRVPSYGTSFDILTLSDDIIINLWDNNYTISSDRIQNFFRYHRASVRNYVEIPAWHPIGDGHGIFVCWAEDDGRTKVVDITSLVQVGDIELHIQL